LAFIAFVALIPRCRPSDHDAIEFVLGADINCWLSEQSQDLNAAGQSWQAGTLSWSGI
jgi:hypothetical protein